MELEKVEEFPFKYLNIAENGIVKRDGYVATRSPDGFISLKTAECNNRLAQIQNPPGWKIHISIMDDDANMIAAWNAIVDIFLAHCVSFVKFQIITNLKDSHNRIWECGRHFTIYINQNPEKGLSEWQNFINDVTTRFIQNGIQPGFKNIIAKQIPGSNFFYYRNDTAPNIPDEIIDIDEPTSYCCCNICNRSHQNEHQLSPVPKIDLTKISAVSENRTVIECQKIYRYFPEESWYNPSKEKEQFLAELRVENNFQREVPCFPEVYEEIQEEAQRCRCVCF